jgi:parallel beta-helix repeat protein
MKRQFFCGSMLLLLVAMSAVAFHVCPAGATGDTIYIRADGSIDPATAPVSTVDNVTYILTAPVQGSLVIERDNMVLDGAGYNVEGDGTGNGTTLAGTNNVTIRNLSVENFTIGFLLSSSSGCTVMENNATNDNYGILLLSSIDNNVSDNSVSGKYETNGYFGIQLENSSDNTISANNVADNLLNVWFDSSSDNTFSHNTLTNSTIGVEIDYSSNNNVFSENNVTDNAIGVMLDYSSGNLLRSNTLVDNAESFGITGQDVTDFVNDVDTSNTVDGKPIIYWVNAHDAAVPPNAGCVILVNCSGISVQNLNITDGRDAILLAYTTNTTITQNTITNSLNGVWLQESGQDTVSENNISNGLVGVWLLLDLMHNVVSDNNVTNENEAAIGLNNAGYDSISGNTVTNSEFGIDLGSCDGCIVSGNTAVNNSVGILLQFSGYNTIVGNNLTGNNNPPTPSGIAFEESSGNVVYHNDFANNVQVSTDDRSVNQWDDGYPSGGNYWSNYNGTDKYSGPHQNLPGSDGIGDTPYNVSANSFDDYPLMKPYLAVHDVGIVAMSPQRTVDGQGYPVDVTVNVANLGDYVESFNVTACVNGTTIATQQVQNLDAAGNISLTFVWNTSILPYGNYTLTAYASPVPDETNSTNNNCTDGLVIVSLPGDVTGPTGWPDGKVDKQDITAIAALYGINYPNPRYNPNYDINGDGKIDIKDVHIAAVNYGKTISR